MTSRTPSIAGLVLLLAACRTDLDPSGRSGGVDDDDGAPARDGSGGFDESAYEKRGYIDVYVGSYEEEDGTLHTISAVHAFYQVGPRTPELASCVTEELSFCTMVTCSPGDVTAAPRSYFRAGTMRVTGNSEEVTLKPDPDDYGDTYPDRVLFTEGDEVSAKVSGSAEVPAHDIAVVAPFAPIIPDPTEVPSVDRSEPFTQTWMGGTGEVLLTLRGSALDGVRPVTITCGFNAEDGSGTIPPEVLGRLYPSFGTRLTATVETKSSIAIADYLVTMRAWTPVRTPTKAVFDVPIFLE
jgi:hypothetical protein